MKKTTSSFLKSSDQTEFNNKTTSKNQPKRLLVSLKNICFSYPGSDKSVLDHLDMDIYEGDHIGMIAPNGTGKTTLLHTIMGLCCPDKGDIQIFGSYMQCEKDFASIRTRIGFLFQDSDDQLFCPSVLEDVAFGPLNIGFTSKEAKQIAEEKLELLGIQDLGNAITHKLSGGQKRLVALAAVLAMSPEILLLDEPTTGLDSKIKHNLSKVLTKDDLTYLVISHEFDFINIVADKVMTIEKGKVLTDRIIHLHCHEHIHKYGNRLHTHH